jgi:orotidine 5'-phosphate decarboxylase subfamily 1/orotate phosphoribosyltransferase
MTKEQFVLELQKTGAIKFGSFTLKSGLISPFYFDLRDMISYPELLDGVSDLLVEKIKDMEFDVLTGIPYTALPIASLVASKLKKPLVYMRKEEKAYGTGKNIIGKFKEGDKCLVIDDLITTGASKIETAEAYEKEGVIIKDFVVVIDRSANGTEELAKKGYELHSLIKLDKILELLQNRNLISNEKVNEVKEFTASISKPKEEKKEISNPLTKKLLAKIKAKRSNLVLSLDVTSQKEFFKILDDVGPEIVMLKTHVDILDDYDEKFVPKLQEYSKKYDFLIFEDRKFADIGNTVHKQYRSGIYKIAYWAEYVTVHMVAGESILKGLFDGIESRSSFILARMSSQGNLINETYSRKCFEIARRNPMLVSGFIGHGKDVEDIKRFKAKFPPGMLLLMPGVKLEKGSDSMGQQYITVEEAVQGGADCIIVGRGIYGNENPGKIAKIYREKAWKEYEKRN